MAYCKLHARIAENGSVSIPQYSFRTVSNNWQTSTAGEENTIDTRVLDVPPITVRAERTSGRDNGAKRQYLRFEYPESIAGSRFCKSRSYFYQQKRPAQATCTCRGLLLRPVMAARGFVNSRDGFRASRAKRCAKQHDLLLLTSKIPRLVARASLIAPCNFYRATNWMGANERRPFPSSRCSVRSVTRSATRSVTRSGDRKRG